MDRTRRKTHALARRFAGLLLTAAALGGAAPASATVAPAQGLYDQCDPGTQPTVCAEHLQRLGQAGFKVILNYTVWWGSEADLRAYADAAAAAGVQIIWPMNDAVWRHGGMLAKYAKLAATCGCSDDAGFQRYLVNLVSSLPATWGYYIGDELPATELPAAQTLASTVRGLDGGHQLLYVANGNRPDPAAQVAPFTGLADVVGSDSYPYGLGGSSSTVGIVGRALTNAMSASPASRAMVLQAFDWGEYPDESGVTTSQWPTRDEMHAALQTAVDSASPSLVLWYSLHSIESSADPAAHWADLVAAAFGALKEPAKPHARVAELSRRVAHLVVVKPHKRTRHARKSRRLRGYEMHRPHRKR